MIIFFLQPQNQHKTKKNRAKALHSFQIFSQKRGCSTCFEILSEIRFQQSAPGIMFQSPDSLLLNLTYPFAGQVKFGTNLFKG